MKINLVKIVKAFVPYGVVSLWENRDTKANLLNVVKSFTPYGIVALRRKNYMKNRKGAISQIINENYKYPFIIREETSDRLVYEAVILKGEYEFKTKTEPKTIIDAGANIGLTSVYFANKYPKAKIIAIEPEESNYEMLVKNTKNYTNVITVKEALFDKIRKLDLLDVGLDKVGFMTEVKENYEQIKLNNFSKISEINSITISKIIQDYNLSEIDILKIDIEGAEKEVFANASEWIHKVKAIIVELHERMKVGCNRTFYCNTPGFEEEWQKGENVYLTKENFIFNPNSFRGH